MNTANTLTANSNSQAAVKANLNEFLTFALGEEEYGVDILCVQEIRRYEAVTHIANSQSFFKGVVNLRGVIVPIVDMRIKFGLSKVEYDQFTVVIILNVAGRVIGMVVDGVSDVINLTSEYVRPAPELTGTLGSGYIIGLGTIDNRMLILIDIEKLMTSADMALIEQTQHVVQ